MASETGKYRVAKGNNKGRKPDLGINLQNSKISPKASLKKTKSHINKNIKRHGIISVTIMFQTWNIS